jgi:hypothetical protein
MTATRSYTGNEGHLLDIDEDKPWYAFPVPDVVEAKTSTVSMIVDDSEFKGGRLSLFSVIEDEVIGYPSSGGLENISTRIQFPMQFVEKLTMPLQALIINERLMANPELTMNFVREPYQVIMPEGGLQWSNRRLVTNIAPGWREVVPHGDICQTAYNLMASIWEPSSLEIKFAKRNDSSMLLRILSPDREEVTKQVGDILQMGIEVEHAYGWDLTVRLYTERLVCLNGMTARDTRFEWKLNIMGKASQQLEFVETGVGLALESFARIVDQARIMAQVPLEGNPELLLMERAKAMKLPAGLTHELLQMWRQEPIATEWGALNAFTRLATHGEQPSQVARRRIMDAAGTWSDGFDMVTARLPRPMALAAGAHILETVS